QILGSDAKRLQIYLTMVLAGTDTLLAANEQMLLNVDMSGPHAAPFAPAVMAKVQMLTLAHRSLPRPKYAGRAIALPH
ncbi:MAG: thioesterase, partial [Burkholderiaceae bacterium]